MLCNLFLLCIQSVVRLRYSAKDAYKVHSEPYVKLNIYGVHIEDRVLLQTFLSMSVWEKTEHTSTTTTTTPTTA